MPDHATAADPVDPTMLTLCVDLDGTLIRTDSLIESGLGVAKDPAALIRIPGWLIQGKARLKAELAARAPLDPEHLPYHEPLLQFLRQEQARGRRLVLATAANHAIADRIAAYLGLFDAVIASDDRRNLRGSAKAAALVEQFGERGFSYVGNDDTDLAVWRHAAGAVLVGVSPALRERAKGATRIEAELPGEPLSPRALFKALRPHQWLKNSLVFVPILTANAFLEIDSWRAAIILFWALCAAASAIYLINDLTDLAADRKHPRKRRRPFASGALPIIHGLWLTPLLLLTAAGLASAVGALYLVALYAVLSIAYSVGLKRQPLIDVFTLAALYSLRLLAGGEVSGHSVSLWLFAFSSFLFLSLALVKRVAELKALPPIDWRGLSGRGYISEDIQPLYTMGITSSFAAALVLAIYVKSDMSTLHYLHPVFLNALAPLMLFWQCRLWLSTMRGFMDDDPILYSVRDWVSWIVGALMVATLLIANFPF